MEYHERLIPGNSDWRENIAGHMQRYRFAGQFVAGKRVLDAGCGVGYGCGILQRAGASEVVGVDISEEALDIARKQFCRPGIRFVHGDCESLDLGEGNFDAIVALESLEHLPQPRNFLSRARNLLHGSGVLVCSTPNDRLTQPVNGRPRNPYHVHEYALEEFRALLADFFSDTLLLGQCYTAAYLEVMRLWQMRSNPAVRIGQLLQRLRFGEAPPVPPIMPTEGDYVISEANLEDAMVFLAVCRHPCKGATNVGPGLLGPGTT